MKSKIGQVSFGSSIAPGSEDGYIELPLGNKLPELPTRMPFRVEHPNKINHKNKKADVIEVQRQADLVGLHFGTVSLYGRSCQEEKA